MSSPLTDSIGVSEKPSKIVFCFRRLHRSLLAASIVLTASTFLLFCWHFKAFAIVKPLPQFGSITPWTILLQMMTGVALFFSACEVERTKPLVFQTIAKLFAGVVFLGAAVFLTEILSGRTFPHLDQWWFQNSVTLVKDAVPGRPSPQSCITFLFFAAACIAFHPTSPRRILASQVMTASGLFMPLLAVLGYIFFVTPLFAGKPFFLGMSCPTLISFLMLAFGLLALRPTRGIVGVVTSNRLSGKTARHLLTFMIPIPLVLGWLLSYVTQNGLLSQQVATALSVLMIIFLLMILTLHLARLIQRHEDEQTVATTAREKLVSELEQARDVALSSTKLKSEFLANMSHEIRTPMNGVIGMAGLLLDANLGLQERQFAETIRASGETLLAIINDILDFSKIEAGKLNLEHLDFNLIDAVESTVELMAESAVTKGIELASAIASDLPTRLRGDPGRLRQILTNLIGNALKFTERGEVVIRVSKESETETHTRVRFRVEDTGIGIPLEAQGKLFQAFIQADGSTTRKYGGTGLGLAIAKQLVALMQGEIGVRSEWGKGSSFWFTAELEKQTGSARDFDPTLRNLVGVRVLVVDDNATNRRILLHQLNAWKMEVQTAANGQEALGLLQTAVQAGRPCGVALLDVQMPEMDGFMLARAIKIDPAIGKTPLIVLTSLGQAMSTATLKESGIEAYLVKPVKQSRLLECLVAALDRVGIDNVRSRLDPPASGLLFSAPNLPTEKVRILMAEDNSVNQKVAMAQLRQLGYRADPVANGFEVLEALKSLPYEVILMDCQMPQMDGYQATQAIRQQEQSLEPSCPWKPPIYIIAMTAHAMDGAREKCLEAGMDDYLSKPVRAPELQAALERGKRAVSTSVMRLALTSTSPKGPVN